MERPAQLEPGALTTKRGGPVGGTGRSRAEPATPKRRPSSQWMGRNSIGRMPSVDSAPSCTQHQIVFRHTQFAAPRVFPLFVARARETKNGFLGVPGIKLGPLGVSGIKAWITGVR